MIPVQKWIGTGNRIQFGGHGDGYADQFAKYCDIFINLAQHFYLRRNNRSEKGTSKKTKIEENEMV